MQTEQIGELAKALALSQSKMKLIIKDSDNPYFKSKYAGLDAVMHEFKSSFAPNGLAISQEFVPHENKNLMALRTTLMHLSGQWISGTQEILPKGTGVQDVMSASTYARRYGICAITGITSTGEDDDGNAASGNVPVKKEVKTSIPEKKDGETWAKKVIVATSVLLVKPGEFVIKVEKSSDMFTNKEEVAAKIKLNLNKPIEVSYTVDKDMYHIILGVVKV